MIVETIIEIDDFCKYPIGNKSWETGHTPILIKDGIVIGIGWRALKVNGIETSDISIETRSR